DNQIAIKVDDGVNAANTYNLTITRKKSSNNLLQDIQLSNGELSPKFDAAVTSYSVQVANEVNEITVSPVAAENTASILVNDSPVTDKGVSVQLSAEKTEITIVVTAENGEKKTYSVEVTKASAVSAGSGTANSSSGSARSGTSNSSSGSTGNNRPSNLSTAGFSQSSSKKAGLTQSSNKSAGLFGLKNTSSSQTQGSQQGGTAVQQPSKATLSTLSVSAGTWNKTFSKDTYTYHIAVDNGTDSVTVTAAPTYSGAAVTILDGTTNIISLGNQKKSIVPIVVTYNGERKTYILVIDKDVPDATATAAASQTVSTTDNSSADTSIKNTSATSSTNNWTGRNNNNSNNTNGSSSFWSRFIDSIRSFFSKL
ncbi:MAG: cadherin-like beta sandwich domain-containing protein, partial [Bacillota bacterium]|nr:cadherin-like beta sandwich domain-containing protein [Bacillota bacterium]